MDHLERGPRKVVNEKATAISRGLIRQISESILTNPLFLQFDESLQQKIINSIPSAVRIAVAQSLREMKATNSKHLDKERIRQLVMEMLEDAMQKEDDLITQYMIKNIPDHQSVAPLGPSYLSHRSKITN